MKNPISGKHFASNILVKVKGKKEVYQTYDDMQYEVNYVRDRTPPAPKITVVSSRHN